MSDTPVAVLTRSMVLEDEYAKAYASRDLNVAHTLLDEVRFEVQMAWWWSTCLALSTAAVTVATIVYGNTIADRAVGIAAIATGAHLCTVAVMALMRWRRTMKVMAPHA